MSFEIKPATRAGVTPLIMLYSESGCGKTFSSLLLARGFVGPTGKIAMIDTESGRGRLYADVIPGGYDVLDLEPPFTPARYIEAMDAVVKAGYSIVVMDSGSHCWEGQGGVNDMAGDNEDKSGKPGLHNWRKPKMEHQKFLLALLRCPIPVICCLRAKFKTRQTRHEGKTQIVKDEFISAIQSEDFLFEATLHGEIMPNHSLRITKASHPELRKCFPDGAPITSEHGAMMASWCNQKTATPPPSKAKASPAKTRLWNATKAVHGGEISKLEAWLKEKGILEDKTLSELSEGSLSIVADQAQIAMQERSLV